MSLRRTNAINEVVYVLNIPQSNIKNATQLDMRLNCSFQSLQPAVDYIITQSPLPATIVDLWRLVYDHDIDVIVSLNSSDEEVENLMNLGF